MKVSVVGILMRMRMTMVLKTLYIVGSDVPQIGQAVVAGRRKGGKVGYAVEGTVFANGGGCRRLGYGV